MIKSKELYRPHRQSRKAVRQEQTKVHENKIWTLGYDVMFGDKRTDRLKLKDDRGYNQIHCRHVGTISLHPHKQR